MVKTQKLANYLYQIYRKYLIRFLQKKIQISIGNSYSITPDAKKCFYETIDLVKEDMRITLDRTWRHGSIRVNVQNQVEATDVKNAFFNGAYSESFLASELIYCSDLICEEIDAESKALKIANKLKQRDGSLLPWLEEKGFEIANTFYGCSGKCIVKALDD